MIRKTIITSRLGDNYVGHTDAAHVHQWICRYVLIKDHITSILRILLHADLEFEFLL